VQSFVAELPSRWSGQRVLVIGHIATRWQLKARCKAPSLCSEGNSEGAAQVLESAVVVVNWRGLARLTERQTGRPRPTQHRAVARSQ
jgi:hypothetical protein